MLAKVIDLMIASRKCGVRGAHHLLGALEEEEASWIVVMRVQLLKEIAIHKGVVVEEVDEVGVNIKILSHS